MTDIHEIAEHYISNSMEQNEERW